MIHGSVTDRVILANLSTRDGVATKLSMRGFLNARLRYQLDAILRGCALRANIVLLSSQSVHRIYVRRSHSGH